MLQSGFYNAVGAIIRAGLLLLSIPVLIRLIGVQEYGLWTLVSAIIGLVTLAEAGLSVSTTVFISRDLASDNPDGISETLTVVFSGMLVLATAAALGLWLAAPALVSLFTNLEQSQQLTAVPAIQIGGMVIWARLIQQIVMGLEQAYHRYRTLNILNTLQTAFNSVGLIGVAWLGGRTVALMQWQAITTIGILVAHIWVGYMLVRGVKLHSIWNTEKARDITHYSLLTWVASLGSALFSQVDRLIVGVWLGTQALGVYGAITNIATQINSLSALSVQPLLPALSNLLAKKNENQLAVQALVKQALHINTLSALGLGAALLTLTPLLLQIMLPGQVTDEAAWAFRLAMCIYALYSMNAVGYFILFGTNAAGLCASVQLTGAICSLLLIAVGAAGYGLVGAVIGNIGYLAVWLLTFLGMRRLDIPLRLWLGWLQFPLAWLLAMILWNMMAPRGLTLSVLTLTLQSVILCVWFITGQHIDLQLVVRKLMVR